MGGGGKGKKGIRRKLLSKARIYVSMRNTRKYSIDNRSGEKKKYEPKEGRKAPTTRREKRLAIAPTPRKIEKKRKKESELSPWAMPGGEKGKRKVRSKGGGKRIFVRSI